MTKITTFLNWAILLIYIGFGQVYATAFTDKSALLAALPGPVGVLNFEGLLAGTDLSGTTQMMAGLPGVSIQFPNSIVDGTTILHFQVVADNGGSNPTTSSANSLGTDDTGNYNTMIAGEVFTLNLTRTVNAFGLSFISPEAISDDDIRLLAGGETASLAAGSRTLVANFGNTHYYAYFLGLVSNTGFGSASIQYGPNATAGSFTYNVDDITVAVVSEPNSAAMLLAGMPLLLLYRRRLKA